MKSIMNFNKKALLLPLMLFVATASQAQSTTMAEGDLLMLMTLGFVFIIAVLVLVVAVYLLKVLRTIVKQEAMEKAAEAGIAYEEEPSLWQKLDRKIFTKAVAIEDEETIVLEHDYDGIRELDNHLPPWWKYMFYMSVVWAVVYIIVFHVTDTLPLQTEEYENELALAEAVKLANIADNPGGGIDENTVEYSADAAMIASGKKIFAMNCAPCHKENGEGGIGPNLTDEHWLNGGGVKNIFKAVKFGFPDKGMISWEPLLSPQQMSDVSSFVMSIQGSNPANAKAPQGEKYVAEATTEAVADSVAVE